jgi:hypothetical protein
MKNQPMTKENVNLTETSILILNSLDLYKVLGFDSSMIELQKLVYFLQRFGQPFARLEFVKGYYGPYSSTLNKMLFDLEGHYLHGTKFKDAKPTDLVELVKEKIPEIRAAQAQLDEGSKARLEAIKNLMDGFESPLGMELLATVDWVLREQPETRMNPDLTVKAVHNWTIEQNGQSRRVTRKQKALQPDHILIARNRLLKFADSLYPN